MAPIRLLAKSRVQRGSTYLNPYVCFSCSKCFRKSPSDVTRSCPQCAGQMVMLNRKFSTPKQRDKEQWAKVKQLVEHGFYFFSVYEVGEHGERKTVPYPARLSQVPSFVAMFREQSALFEPTGIKSSRAKRASAGDA